MNRVPACVWKNAKLIKKYFLSCLEGPFFLVLIADITCYHTDSGSTQCTVAGM